MEKIIVKPQKVRGLGNIIDPKTYTDFGEYNSNLGYYTSTAYGTIYTSSVITGSYLTLSYNKILTSTGNLTVTATLKKNDNTVVSSATLSCYFDEQVYTATTNSSGVATFTLPVQDEGEYSFKIIWTGVHNTTAGCIKTGMFYCGNITGLELYRQSPIFKTGDTCNLISQSYPEYNDVTVTYLLYNPSLFNYVGSTSSSSTDDQWVYDWTPDTDAVLITGNTPERTRFRSITGSRYIWANLTSTTSNAYDFYPQHLRIEFDTLDIYPNTTGVARLVVTTTAYGTDNYQTYIKEIPDGEHHIRAELENGEFKYYIDEVLTSTDTFNTKLFLRIGLNVFDGTYLDFKNFKLGGF